MTAVLSLMGPRSHDLMQRVEPRRRVAAGPGFSHTREIDLGLARVRAARMSYVGGPGYELYVPIEMARHVYLALHEAGHELGVTDAGYYAIDALRIEAGRRAWGAELGPDETPWEAGLAFAVKLDKPASFIGRDALRVAQAQPLRKKLLAFVLDESGSLGVGRRGDPARRRIGGRTGSTGWGFATGRCVALGYVRGPAALQVHAGTPVQIDLWGEAVGATAWDDAAAYRQAR